MAAMGITTRRIREGEGELLKAVRLAALLDAPGAFARSYEEESLLSWERWDALAQERSAGREHATFFAVDGDRIVGLVGGHRSAERAEVELVSMWADPAERGRGIGAALVEAVVGWADGDPVGLWVMRGNEAAYHLYGRCGFVESGDYEALPSDPCKDEVRMSLAIEPETSR